MKTGSASLTREMQIKTTDKPFINTSRRVGVGGQGVSNNVEKVGKIGALVQSEYGYSPWRAIWQYLVKLEMCMPYNPMTQQFHFRVNTLE